MQDEITRASAEPARHCGGPGGSESCGFLSWATDASGERSGFSRAWRAFTGRDVDWPACLHPEDRDGVERAFHHAFSARGAHEAEFRLRRADGEYRWMLEQAAPEYAEDGSFLGYRGVCLDITRRKLAEDSLRESEQRFRRSFEHPLTGMIIASPQKVFFEVNDKLCEMLGYTREELVGKSWADFTHPDDVTPNTDVLGEVIAGRSDGYVLEKRYRRKDGHTVHAVISARAVRDAKGEVQYLVTMVQDVTASRRMERLMQAIVESTSAVIGESFFLSLVEHLAGALNARFALVGQFIDEAPSTVDTVAVWDRGGMVPNFRYSLAGTACEQVARGCYCVRQGELLNVASPGALAGGKLGDVGVGCSACAPLFDHTGRPLGVVVVASDRPFEDPHEVRRVLTVFAARAGAELERLRADRELTRSRALLRSIVEHIPHVLFLKDARDLRYVVFNRAGERLLGCRREQVIGRQDHELYSRALAETFVSEDRQVLASGEMLEIPEQRMPTAKGAGILRVLKIPLFDENGRPEYILGIAEDITDRVQARQQLMDAKAEAERANNAKSRFLAAASHDLRQPLSALSLYVGVLKNKVAPPDRALLNNMKDCVGSLSELLTNLLDLSKLDAGVVTPNVVDFPIDEIIANLVSVHAPEAILKGLRLRCVTSDLVARTDPVLFRRMIGNLVSNAIRYTPRGSVLIGCRRRQGSVWVEVWDTGIGIPEDKTAEVFEEFRQIGNDERNGVKGSGLGLAIVAKTAALLGLGIRVESRPGKGSVFAVEMPRGRISGRRSMVDFQPRQLRIALVEDNLGVRNALVYTFQQSGHEVVAAAGGRELLDLLGNTAPDIVVSDYRLCGGETGFDVIESARARFGNGLAAMIITGDTDPQVTRSMADRGIVVQHKPLDIEALRACIATLTERRVSPRTSGDLARRAATARHAAATLPAAAKTILIE